MKPDNSIAKTILALGIVFLVAFLYRDGTITSSSAAVLLVWGYVLVTTIF